MKESAVDWTDASAASHIRCHHLWSPGSTLTLRPGSPYNWKIVPLYHLLLFPPTPVPRRPPFDSLSMRLIFFFFMILPIIDRNGEGNGRYLCLNISHTKVSSSFTHVVAKGKISPFLTWVIFPCVIPHSFLISLSISGPLGCFHVLAVVTMQQWA